MWLVSHKVLTGDQSAQLVAHGTSAGTVLAFATFLVPLAWSLWAKMRARVKLNTALVMPAGTSEDQVKRVIANGTGAGVTAAVLCLAAVLGAGALVSSCAPKTWHNPATIQAFNKDSVVKALGGLQHTAITLAEATPPRISVAQAGLVVDTVQTVLDAADASGAGIVGTAAAVLRGLTQGNPAAGIPPKLNAQTLAVIGPYVQTVLDELTRQGGQ